VTIRIMLAGEGPNELGGWARHPSYRDSREAGVLEALLRCLRADGWEIHEARLWKDKPQTYRSLTGTPKRVHPEEHKVAALALDASESGCDALVFVRDDDGDARRTQAIKAGIELAKARAIAWMQAGKPLVMIAGATAVPTLEAWLLALSGRSRTEELSRSAAGSALEAQGVRPKNTADMRELVERCGVASVPVDAYSLREWLSQVRLVLACKDPD
jgi:hypothetical protein